MAEKIFLEGLKARLTRPTSKKEYDFKEDQNPIYIESEIYVWIIEFGYNDATRLIKDCTAFRSEELFRDPIAEPEIMDEVLDEITESIEEGSFLTAEKVAADNIKRYEEAIVNLKKYSPEHLLCQDDIKFLALLADHFKYGTHGAGYEEAKTDFEKLI
nr:hypothetical protein K-LCC10_0105 [Kaumoebavirus]